MKNFTKKFLMTLLMLTCVFALTACGEEKAMSDMQKLKLDAAQSMAEQVVSLTQEMVVNGEASVWLEDFNNIELGYAFTSCFQSATFECEGKAVRSAFTSFQTGIEKMGGIKEFGTPAAEIDGDTIVVMIPVTGESATGSVELIFTNDIFLNMKACTLNLDESVSDLMVKAALNTVLGMGTVFAVLILISYIISMLSLVNKYQGNSKKKETPAAPPAPAAPASVAAAADEAEDELADDEELVAVIAAAIAAYEGTSADGFRVRSIRRANTGKWKRA